MISRMVIDRAFSEVVGHGARCGCCDRFMPIELNYEEDHAHQTTNFHLRANHVVGDSDRNEKRSVSRCIPISDTLMLASIPEDALRNVFRIEINRMRDMLLNECRNFRNSHTPSPADPSVLVKVAIEPIMYGGLPSGVPPHIPIKFTVIDEVAYRPTKTVKNTTHNHILDSLAYAQWTDDYNKQAAKNLEEHMAQSSPFARLTLKINPVVRFLRMDFDGSTDSYTAKFSVPAGQAGENVRDSAYRKGRHVLVQSKDMVVLRSQITGNDLDNPGSMILSVDLILAEKLLNLVDVHRQTRGTVPLARGSTQTNNLPSGGNKTAFGAVGTRKLLS